MSRLIDADALKVSITKYGELHISHKKLPVVKNEAKELIRDICFAIDAKSTADVVPVVHGHWGEPQRDGCITYDKNAYRQCSVCGNRQFLGMQMNYCPQCGAKMDEVTE